MTRIIMYIVIVISLLISSCNSEPTLQKFFVENAEKKDFIALDVSSSILKTENVAITTEQKKALKSFEKMNIIAFKVNDKNQKEYQIEKSKINSILNKEEYQELIKVGSGKDGASISFVGEEDKIEEFILYANKKENGFAVVRVLGNDMDVNDVMNMLSVIQKSNINIEQLKPLQNLMK